LRRPKGFQDDDLVLLKAVLPVVSLAMMAHAGHTIASGLLEAYLGDDAGRRVHAGAVERGSVESIRAVLWYADIRAFTALADTTPGAVVIGLLDQVFETLTASSRPRGGQVLKFLGDGTLSISSVVAVWGWPSNGGALSTVRGTAGPGRAAPEIVGTADASFGTGSRKFFKCRP
jgi:class 3 adenylate cyclase